MIDYLELNLSHNTHIQNNVEALTSVKFIRSKKRKKVLGYPLLSTRICYIYFSCCCVR